MSDSVMQQGGVGVAIRILCKDRNGAVKDISGYTTAKQIVLTDPTGTSVTKTADFTTDGLDGYLEYVTSLSTDIDVAGRWQAQARLASGSQDYKSSVDTFTVKANL